MPDDKERPAGLLVSARRLAERYERSTRTIDRWVEVGVLPPPIYIRGRKFWPEGTEPVQGPAPRATAPQTQPHPRG